MNKLWVAVLTKHEPRVKRRLYNKDHRKRVFAKIHRALKDKYMVRNFLNDQHPWGLPLLGFNCSKGDCSRWKKLLKTLGFKVVSTLDPLNNREVMIINGIRYKGVYDIARENK